MIKFDAFVARRYLKAKRKQAFIGVISIITLLGITLGVAALNIALAIHNGMRRAFVESLVGSTGQLYVVADTFIDQGFDQEEVEAILRVIGTIPAVHGASLMRQEHAVIISDKRRMAFGMLKGIIPGEHGKTTDRLANLEEGSLDKLEKPSAAGFPGIILGYDLARRLGASRGDPLRVAIPRMSSPGLTRQGLRLKQLRCEVVGIFRTGNSQFDEMDAYLRLDDLLMLLNTTRIQSVLVSFQTLADMDRGKQRLLAHPGLPPTAGIVDLRDLNRNLLKALRLEKAATTSVIGLFILIVGLNMVSALIMLVMEKHRDIGIMKSFGTPRTTILKIFIRQGMTLSLWGTLMGTALGLGLSWLADSTRIIRLDNSVYEVLSYLPFKPNPTEALLVAFGSLLLAFISALYPAQQAASLDPVEALRYD